MNLKEFASENKTVLLRTGLIFAMIVLAAALRLAPHPWNFTPVGAIALFSGAMVRDRRLAFLFPVLVMLATDAIIGFNKLSLVVYVSFLLSVVIGQTVIGARFRLPANAGEAAGAKRESEPGGDVPPQKYAVARIAGATFLGALQFFFITNFGDWALLNTYPRTGPGLIACYIAGVPLFWNTIAGDAVYSALLFGGFFLAERLAPRLRPSVTSRAS
jgi:hypothetical protein